MPIYDYRCSACGSTYDIYHKVREVADDVRCPDCGAADHVRLISAPSVRTSSPAPGRSIEAAPVSCCGGGRCNVN